MVALPCTKIPNKGRPTLQLSPEIEATLRSSYDGSATCVHALAHQYGVADSTIRAWARRLGLTQRSRPRPQTRTESHGWKFVARPASEGQDYAVVPDRDTTATDVVGTYLNEMGTYPRLTAQQERFLGERAALGDQEARHALIVANLRLVVRVARNYAAKSHYSLPLLDLIQEGTLGLMHAVDIYDVGRGWRFSTHATWWIRQAISRAQMEKGRTIRLPVGAQEQIQDLQQLLLETTEELTLEEIAGRLSVSSERAKELLTASQQIQSLDAPAFGERADLSLGQLLESPLPTPQDHVEGQDLRHHLLCLLQTLRRPRDRKIMVLRYGLDGKGERTLEEVARAVGVTRERIRQIESRILLELREGAQARQLQDYLSA